MDNDMWSEWSENPDNDQVTEAEVDAMLDELGTNSQLRALPTPTVTLQSEYIRLKKLYDNYKEDPSNESALSDVILAVDMDVLRLATQGIFSDNKETQNTAGDCLDLIETIDKIKISDALAQPNKLTSTEPVFEQIARQQNEDSTQVTGPRARPLNSSGPTRPRYDPPEEMSDELKVLLTERKKLKAIQQQNKRRTLYLKKKLSERLFTTQVGNQPQPNTPVMNNTTNSSPPTNAPQRAQQQVQQASQLSSRDRTSSMPSHLMPRKNPLTPPPRPKTTPQQDPSLFQAQPDTKPKSMAEIIQKGLSPTDRRRSSSTPTQNTDRVRMWSSTTNEQSNTDEGENELMQAFKNIGHGHGHADQ